MFASTSSHTIHLWLKWNFSCLSYLPGKAELQIEGYELFLSESTSFSKWGAALYINKKLKSEEIKFKEKFEESVWAQIKLNNDVVTGMYI